MSLTNSELAPESAEDDFEMRRHVDITLRLQRISTLLIGEGTTAHYMSTSSTLPLI